MTPTRFFDTEHPALRRQVEMVTTGASSDVEKATRLYYWVRDGWRYDPFGIQFTPEFHVASRALEIDYGYCVSKAILLSSAARVAGIPSALGLADVENHLTSEKLKQQMGGSSVFINHGYSMLYIGGNWVKAAPAFNIEMCQRFGVRPTEFDGRGDAILQEFDTQNRRHMEYLTDHGCWSDFPYEDWVRTLSQAYQLENWGSSREPKSFAPD